MSDEEVLPSGFKCSAIVLAEGFARAPCRAGFDKP